MRFYEIALFIIILNMSIFVVNSFNVFDQPNSGMNYNWNSISDLNSTTSGITFTVPNENPLLAGFTAFIYLPTLAFGILAKIVTALYIVFFGVGPMLYQFMGCTAVLSPTMICNGLSGSAKVGVDNFVMIIEILIGFVYAVTAIQLFRGQNLESN